MNNQNIKSGSVVVLRSGGPKMTVASISELASQKLAFCGWFCHDEYRTSQFYLPALELYEENNSKNI